MASLTGADGERTTVVRGFPPTLQPNLQVDIVSAQRNHEAARAFARSSSLS